MGNESSKPQLYTRISRALPPLAPQYGPNENIDWVDKGVKAFASEGDRDQFIYGLISLASSNGSINLENHDIKLFFSRRQYEPKQPQHPQSPSSSNKAPSPARSPPSWRSFVTPSSSAREEAESDDGTRVLATLVAIDEKGVIKVKIEPEADGKNVAEAFRAFKRDVEIQLERLLREVPTGGSSMVGGGKGMGGQSVVERERERARPLVAAAEPVTADRGFRVVDAPPAYGDVKKG